MRIVRACLVVLLGVMLGAQVLAQNDGSGTMLDTLFEKLRVATDPVAIQTLESGDILATGTNHRGLNAFMDGDRIELTVEKVGTLRIGVKDDLKRTWARTTRLQHKESGGEGNHTPQLTGKYAKK